MWQFRVPENLQGNTYPSNPCHRNELISGGLPGLTAKNQSATMKPSFNYPD
jgi:hypothetical protein